MIGTVSSMLKVRKPDGDAIAELALANFIEMRDKVVIPEFLLQRKSKHGSVINILDRWIPPYTMVTFSPDIRYSQAWEGQRQERIMQQVMQVPGIETAGIPAGWRSDVASGWRNDERPARRARRKFKFKVLRV